MDHLKRGAERIVKRAEVGKRCTRNPGLRIVPPDDSECCVRARGGIEVADAEPVTLASVLHRARPEDGKSDELVYERNAKYHRQAGRAQRNDVEVRLAGAIAGHRIAHVATSFARTVAASRDR